MKFGGWEGIAAFIGIIVSISGMIYWAVERKIMEKLDKKYMTLGDCQKNHMTTDVMIKAVHDKIGNQSEKIDMLVNQGTVILEHLLGHRLNKKLPRK